MPPQRYSPVISNSANVRNSFIGTDNANLVGIKDLEFWLPLTKPYLKFDVPGADNLAQLLTLPKAHKGHILSVLLPIYRQNRKPVPFLVLAGE